MRLLTNWQQILKRAWSVRFQIFAAVFSVAEVALPLVQQIYMVPAGLFALLSVFATVGAIVTRVLAQQSIGGKQ